MSDKGTTNLYYLIRSELDKRGKNEFFNNMRLTISDKDYRFVYKIMKYDEDIQEVVNDTLFYGFEFSNKELDLWFKKTFVTKYLNRKLKNQTREHMTMLLIGYLEEHRQWVELTYENFENLFSGGTSSNVTGDKETENNGRAVAQSNPQDKFNLNVRDYEFDTVDAASGNNTLGTENSKTNSVSQSFDPSTAEQMFRIYKPLFTGLSKLLFAKFY